MIADQLPFADKINLLFEVFYFRRSEKRPKRLRTEPKYMRGRDLRSTRERETIYTEA